MSGIAALAAAAVASKKIDTTAGMTTTSSTTTTAMSGIKVVTPTVVTPSSIKVTPVTSRSG